MLARRLSRSRRSLFRPGRRKVRTFIQISGRSGGIPKYWRVVDGRLNGPDGEPARGRATGMHPSPRLLAWWKLALDAGGIPWMTDGRGSAPRLFVPALYERMARIELAAVTEESLRGLPAPLPLKHNLHWTLLFLLLFLVWQGFVGGWFQAEGLSGAQTWADLWKEAGALDVGRVLRNGEYWRCITALTLHADAQHFFGNLLFGGLLLGLTARRMGLGLALLLTVSAGTLGNALNVLYRPPDHVSLGFSTAVFGLAGILGADAALREGLGHGGWRRALLPAGAALALLALLGTEGERTDYAAHVFGLLSGIFLGLIAGYALREHGLPRRFFQILTAFLALLIPTLAWLAAFRG